VTSPQEPAEQSQQPPTSPQVESTEDALEAAESSIAPVIAAMLLAAMLADSDNDTHPVSGNIARGGLFASKHIVKTMAAGVTGGLRGVLALALLPLVMVRLRVMITDEYLLGGDGTLPYVDLETIARESVEKAIDRAADALAKAAANPEPVDIYDRYNGKATDTRTDSQRKADAFGTSTARWLTREAVFDAQEKVGQLTGVTHKRWVTEHDDRVRFEHKHLDGKVVPADGIFVTETGSLRYPGDISAPLHLTINCRCSLEWLKRP
jgi:hypothetical protein